MNYSFPPFDSTGTGTAGPLLSDIADNMYPILYKNYYSAEGFSLWENNVALGVSNNAIAEYMNPTNWVYLLPFEIAIFLKCLSEFIIGFFAMYLFMRSIGVKKYSAALSGVIYVFSSVIVVWLGWPHSDVAVWAPLLFFAIEKMISTMKVKYMFLSAMVIYIMLMVGMPTYAAYFLYLAGIYIVIFTCIRHWENKRNIVIVGVMFATSVILAALASLPYTYTLLTDVTSSGYTERRTHLSSAKLEWDYLRTFVFPYIRDGLSQHINESTLYASILSIIMFPLAFFNNKNKRRNVFFLIASIIIFALIFTDVFTFVYTKLPMINTSRKYRVITLLMFTLSVVTGITLNDLFANKDYYIKRKWLCGIITIWICGVMYFATKGLWDAHIGEVSKVIVFIVGIIVCVLVLLKKDYKLVYVALATIIILDSTSFAKKYLPWIGAESEIIPEPTDSVSYLIEHSAEEERFVGIGGWDLFPNTSIYYNLNDVRGHNFVVTNEDMKNYYKSIDENAYDSSTRVFFNNIENYELLKYLGVKYIYGRMVNTTVSIGNDEPNSKVFGVISSYTTLSQEIFLHENPCAINILFATYGSVPQSDENIIISLSLLDTGDVVYETAVSVNAIRDNSYLTIPLAEGVILTEGSYVIELTFKDLQDDTITVWMKEQDNSVVSSDELDVPGAMVMNAEYAPEEFDVVYIGEDSMRIGELEEYADKAELVETVHVYENEEAVLSAMKEEYLDNTAFLVSKDGSETYDIPLTENESIELTEYSDDYVKILCTTEYDRYIALNDYFDESWSVYVNGEKSDMVKANYMMRAVKVSSGEDIVIEFVYEPEGLYRITSFSISIIGLSVLVFVFRRRLQVIVDKLIA